MLEYLWTQYKFMSTGEIIITFSSERPGQTIYYWTITFSFSNMYYLEKISGYPCFTYLEVTTKVQINLLRVTEHESLPNWVKVYQHHITVCTHVTSDKCLLITHLLKVNGKKQNFRVLLLLVCFKSTLVAFRHSFIITINLGRF